MCRSRSIMNAHLIESLTFIPFSWHSHSLLACSHLCYQMCAFACLVFFRCRYADRVKMKNWRKLLKKYARKKILAKKIEPNNIKRMRMRICVAIIWMCECVRERPPTFTCQYVFNFIGKWGCLFINTLCTI